MHDWTGREGILCSHCRGLDAWASGGELQINLCLEADERRNVAGVRVLSSVPYVKECRPHSVGKEEPASPSGPASGS